MGQRRIKEFFWHYPEVVVTDIKSKMLVFDEKVFFAESKNCLRESVLDQKDADSHFAAFQAYLVNDIALSHSASKINKSMRVVFQSIVDGSNKLNESTKFSFSGDRATAALRGIFTAYHETTLRYRRHGRFDVCASPLSYDNDNLIIRLIYFEKDGVLTKLLRKDPPVAKEEVIESKRITKISGDSNGMIVSLLDVQPRLEITPYDAEWLLTT